MPQPKIVKQNSPVVKQNTQNTQPNLASRILSYAGKFGVISVGLAASQLPGANGLNASPTPTPTLATSKSSLWEWEGNGMMPPVVWLGVAIVSVVVGAIAAAVCLRKLRQQEWRDTKARLVLIPPPALPAIEPVAQAITLEATPTPTPITAPVTLTVEATIETPPPKPPRTNRFGTITKSFEEWRAEDSVVANKIGDATRAAYQAAKGAVSFINAPDSEKVMDPHAHKHAHSHEITAPLLPQAEDPQSDTSSASELSTDPGPEQVIPAEPVVTTTAPIEQIDTVVVAPVPYVLPPVEIKPLPRPRSTYSELSASSTHSRPVRLVTSLLSKDVQESLKYILASEEHNPSKKPLYDV